MNQLPMVNNTGKLSNYKKKNKESKGKLQDLFIEDAELLQSALDSMNLALIAFCSEALERQNHYG
ncbi:MAG: hypothetical protein E4G98_02465 [Promethearchaeota archaeon]|nr:MAG: hypothetical protein E4G98_02465 [Candidatus Lokiarchaeota archaeon]